ncbi:MAG: DUF2460 domain-containing protein [Rhizobium sp.]|nr:DUF2460 domain-containing protein [Rhizobium sp.]
MSFHEARFPIDISLGSSGGPERRTDIVTLRSGFEERNAVWMHSRRSYDAGLGVRTVDQLAGVIAFWEARRGRLHGFRWRDWSDYKSCAPLQTPAAGDQVIGTGDAVRTEWQIVKTYMSGSESYERPIIKPVSGTVLASVNGVTLAPSLYEVDTATGVVTFDIAPANGHVVRCGYEFDVPVRFDDDKLDLNLEQFKQGSVPQIRVVELRIALEDIA